MLCCAEQYLLGQSANPDLVNSVGETAEQVCGAAPEAVHIVKEARRLKQGASTFNFVRNSGQGYFVLYFDRVV